MHVLKLPSSLSLLLVLLLPSLILNVNANSHSNGNTALYPPGLHPLITKANTLLSTGQFSDAIKAYTEAIDQSPQDPSLFYKRASAYLSQARHQLALADLSKVVQLSGSGSGAFDRVYLLQAKIHAKEGEFTLAREALDTYLSNSQHSEKDKRDLHEANTLLSSLTSASTASHRAHQSHKARLYTACVQYATDALGLATHSRSLRELRAECEVESGELEAGVGDLIRLTHLTHPSTSLFLRISHLSYFLLPPSSSQQHMTPLKQCLHFDPDSKPCLKTHRKFKALDKAFKKLEEAVEKSDWRGVIRVVWGSGGAKKDEGAEKEELSQAKLGTGLLYDFTHALYDASSPPASSSSSSSSSSQLILPPHLNPQTSSPRLRTLTHALCTAYTRIEQPRRAKKFCEAVLSYKPPGASTSGNSRTSNEDTNSNNSDPKAESDSEWYLSDSIYIDALVGKAESLLAGDTTSGDADADSIAEAVRLLEKAFEKGGRSNGDVLQRLQKAQRVLKQSKRKDYYKILGVARDADQKTIKKAYRKQAKLSHPDKGGSESAMASVNEAYEVLSDADLRARFDAGEDPMDPQSSGPGGGPFAYSGGPGGGFGGFGGGHPFAQFFSGGGAGGGGGHPGGGQQFQFHFGRGF